MHIKSVEFAGAIANINGRAPAALAQVAFSGRSNVGKSSLINRLLGRTRSAIARVSSTPGKTREINFFDVTATSSAGAPLRFYVVDLPGYGYAKVPAAVRQAWQPLIEWYVSNSKQLQGVVQLIDARHEPVEADRMMMGYLEQTGTPTLFVLTKVDKLTRSERPTKIRKILGSLNIDPNQAIEFSSKTGEGRAELLESLEGLISP
ncbi:MAG: ribosome biogenesis GTP-binding protein YihA/YsxC [Gemmatimonadota bacterium]